jgi:hypothetical protein
MTPMRLTPLLTVAALAVGIAASRSTPSHGTEAAGGHYVIGAYALPGAGIVPPEPGLYSVNAAFYYHGSLSAARQVPIGGRLQAGLTGDFAGVNIGAAYIPRLDLGQFTLGFSASLPLWYARGRAALVGPLGREFERTDDVFAFGDMVFSPFMLGWRSRSNSHFAQLRLDVWAPTGDYDVDRLANTGLNYWTFTPTLAYTYLDRRIGLDVSANAGLDFNTRNPKTDYHSGTLFHLDVAATKNVTPELGLGLIFSMLYQIEDDSGGLARRLGGFRGQSFAVGPIARYAFRLGRSEFNATLSWAPEFAVRNRTQGHAFLFTLAGAF